ncbi:hypothetical protein HanXRQr2_Chr09g0384791 [Helianthus annuus]|uniref:Uncharacterized protein n=1 Tax=Helianthus annuus TaxID=4232 RepID=A0A9K3I6R2_HELAN|nr:hypothetical protein HanXRQr2_Chr09g0384791 [Helianthus annuus]
MTGYEEIRYWPKPGGLKTHAQSLVPGEVKESQTRNKGISGML